MKRIKRAIIIMFLRVQTCLCVSNLKVYKKPKTDIPLVAAIIRLVYSFEQHINLLRQSIFKFSLIFIQLTISNQGITKNKKRFYEY